MPLDHYIPQVHLKKFYSPELGERMRAIKKSDLTCYPCDSKSQCRIEDGNTNPFLPDLRIIEEVLKFIEPKYNSSLEKLKNNQLDPESIFSIAGFASYVSCVTPAAARLFSEPLKAGLNTTAKILDNNNSFSSIPASLEC